MNLIPIGAGGDRHAADGKVLVQHVKACRVSASAAGNNSRPDLAVFGKRRAVKQPVEKGQERSIRRAVIHRAADDKPVCFLEFRRDLVDGIVKDAASQLGTAVAGALQLTLILCIVAALCKGIIKTHSAHTTLISLKVELLN